MGTGHRGGVGEEFTGLQRGPERLVQLGDQLIGEANGHQHPRILRCCDHRKDPRTPSRDAGQPPHQNTVGHRWRTTLAAAGLTGVKLHDLRHFYASGLIASGCDVVTVQRALGHASATTTLNTYSHLWPTAEDRTRRAAEELFADSCGLGADSATSTSR